MANILLTLLVSRYGMIAVRVSISLVLEALRISNIEVDFKMHFMLAQ